MQAKVNRQSGILGRLVKSDAGAGGQAEECHLLVVGLQVRQVWMLEARQQILQDLARVLRIGRAKSCMKLPFPVGLPRESRRRRTSEVSVVEKHLGPILGPADQLRTVGGWPQARSYPLQVLADLREVRLQSGGDPGHRRLRVGREIRRGPHRTANKPAHEARRGLPGVNPRHVAGHALEKSVGGRVSMASAQQLHGPASHRRSAACIPEAIQQDEARQQCAGDTRNQTALSRREPLLLPPQQVEFL
mmetsp:Transcript_117731/g.375280  ORF Transcript_117731/g.375280 Transcript_117731/m.375280 type:complete len:247 (+) Transcript_117731:886-1626(+)